MDNAKNPRWQKIGAESKKKGKAFENKLDKTFEYYKRRGFAIIEKTPEPMKVIKAVGQGRFIACYEKKAQPDYKGTIKGGRTVMFEAKYTDSDRIVKSRVSDEQSDYMDRQAAMGARCYVVVGYRSGKVYKIPWDIWQAMKERFGRKYVTENDLEMFEVKVSWNDTLLILS